MSKNNRDYNRPETQEAENTASERVPYVIDVEPQNFEDRAMGFVDNMTSSELCNIANAIFRPAFDDYEGSKLIVDQFGNCYLELWFNHRVPESDDTVVGFSQNVDVAKYKNKTVQRVMNQDKFYREGNSYHPTADAKDAIARYVMSSYKNKKGNVNWEMICGDFAQPTNNMATNYREVLSRITGISPIEILKAQFGSQNKKGANVQYQVKVLNSLPSGMGSAEYLLQIQQIDETQLDRALRNAGFSNPNGLGIIK